MSFGDLERHGHLDIFSTSDQLKWSRAESHNQSQIFQNLWDNFMVHDVINP